jgi:protein O-mannosyl-transferase
MNRMIPDAPLRSPPDLPASDTRAVMAAVWVRGLVIVALAIVPMLPSLSNELLWDDAIFITEHPLLPDLKHGLSRIWGGEYLGDYYPVSHTMLWLEYRMWGPSILGFRLGNLLWHAAGAVVLWGALHAWRMPAAWLVAALYAVHPANVDVAAWASQHKATVAMVFFAGALWAYAESLRQADVGRRRLTYCIALACHTAALLSKTGSVGLPLALMLLEVWWIRRSPELRREFGLCGDLDTRQAMRRAAGRLAPFFLVSLALGVVAIFFMQSRVNLGSGRDWGGLLGRFLRGSWAYVFYWYRSLLPIRLAPVYPVWEPDAARPLHWLPTALVACATGLGVVARRHGGDLVLAAMFWMLALLGPFLYVFDQSYFTRSSVADRYVQMAMLAPLTLAAGAAEMWASRLGLRAWVRPAAVGILFVLAGLSFDHSRAYRSDHAMWSRCVVTQPEAHYAHEALSLAMLRTGDGAGALHHAERAVALAPWFGHNHFVLGAARMRQGDHRHAAAAFAEAIAREPHHAGAWQALGGCRMALGDAESAAEAFRQASTYRQTALHSSLQLARLELQLGRYAEAGPLLVRVLEQNDQEMEAWLGLVIERIAMRDPWRAAVLLERSRGRRATPLQEARMRAWALALPDQQLTRTLDALEGLATQHPDDRVVQADLVIARRLSGTD